MKNPTCWESIKNNQIQTQIWHLKKREQYEPFFALLLKETIMTLTWERSFSQSIETWSTLPPHQLLLHVGDRDDQRNDCLKIILAIFKVIWWYIYYDEVCVCHEKSSLPTSELSARGAKWAARQAVPAVGRLWPSDDDDEDAAADDDTLPQMRAGRLVH